MQSKNIFRFASLLLAFSLLLGLVVTGCTDKDREKSTPDPEPEVSYVYYHFEMPDGQKAIGGAPTNIMVKGYDAEWKAVDATVTEGTIAKLDVDEDGWKVAETAVAEDIKTLVYGFYHTDDNGVNVADAFEIVSVGDDADVYADPEHEECTFAMETLALGDDGLVAASEFSKGDDIYVKVYVVDAQGNKEDVNYIALSSSSAAVTVGDYDETQKAYKCQAADVAEDVELVVKAYDLQVATSKVTVNTAIEKHLYYYLSDTEYSYTLQEDGHLVKDGKCVQSLEEMGNMYLQKYGTEGGWMELDLEFIAVLHCGDDANGYPLFTTEGVPATVDSLTENKIEGSCTCTNKFEGGVLTIHWNAEDPDHDYEIHVTPVLEGWESEMCVYYNKAGGV